MSEYTKEDLWASYCKLHGHSLPNPKICKLDQHQVKKNKRWMPKAEYARFKRLQEFVSSRTGIQMAHDDPNMFKQICREIEHPSAHRYNKGRLQ